MIFLEHDFGRTPAAASEVGRLEAQDVRVLAEQAVDRPAERAGSFSVNNPDMINPAAQALLEILGHERLDLLGPKGMEVEHPVDRNPDGISQMGFFRLYPGIELFLDGAQSRTA